MIKLKLKYNKSGDGIIKKKSNNNNTLMRLIKLKLKYNKTGDGIIKKISNNNNTLIRLIKLKLKYDKLGAGLLNTKKNILIGEIKSGNNNPLLKQELKQIVGKKPIRLDVD